MAKNPTKARRKSVKLLNKAAGAKKAGKSKKSKRLTNRSSKVRARASK